MNKYHNTKITVDGHTFDSKKEHGVTKSLSVLKASE